jgi:hypothetical protein
MRLSTKKILASRYFGVLTILPTLENSSSISQLQRQHRLVVYLSERVNEGLNL